MDDRLELFTLGGLRILKGGEHVKGLGNRKAEALIIYLASTRRPQPREVLADLLWDERTQSRALANLRGLLTVLRKTMGRFLLISRETVSISPVATVWLDTIQMEDGLRDLHQQGKLNISTADRAREALALYRGDFLEGFSVFECRRFEDWLVREKERLHHLAIDGYSELVAYDIQQRQYQSGMVHAAQLLELDPLMEAAHRHMMLLLASCGQRAAALAQFETCRKLLHDELGVAPADETRDLYHQIQLGKWVGGEAQVQVPSWDTQRTQLHNLPLQLTSFIGREGEMAVLRSLLSTSRLVTLTGSGGVGKTRLAVEVSRCLQGEYPHGIWLVELASFSAPQNIVSAICSVFNLIEQPERTLLHMLKDFLQYKRLLLILDNCEHLVTASAEVVEALLRVADEIKILVTSREVLGIAGEVLYQVPTLSLPEMSPSLSLESLGRSEAVRLFVERAGLWSPGYTLTSSNASAIAQICRLLDGIPLAIELAAARVRFLKVEQIGARLEYDFSMLTGGNRTALPKQQTLQATFDWSYNLLTETERIILRRLSIFSRVWDLTAAESICCDWETLYTGPARIQPGDILNILSSLVNKSLVNVTQDKDLVAHYHMLETNRQYAHEKLSESGEEEELKQRHLEYYLRWSEEAVFTLQGPDHIHWLERLEENIGNIRQALSYALKASPQAALRLATTLPPIWGRDNLRLEGLQWLEICLELPENAARTMYRGRALCVLADFSQASLNYKEQLSWSQEALDICAEQEDLFGQAYAHQLLGLFKCVISKDFPAAQAHLDTSLELFRAIGNRWWEAHTLRYYEEINEKTGDIPSAKAYVEQSLKIYQELKDDVQIASCLYYLGFIIGEYEGNLRQGRELYLQSINIIQGYKSNCRVAYVEQLLVCLVFWQGDFAYAEELSEKVSAYYNQIGDFYQALLNTEFEGRLLAFQGFYSRAVELLEQAIDRFSEKFPSDLERFKNVVIPTIVYSLANLGQIVRAKEVLGLLDSSQPTSFFDSRLLPRVSGLLAFLEGDAGRAASLYREWLNLMQKTHYRMGELLALEGCAGALMLLGYHPDAIQCLASASVFRHKSGALVWPGDLPINNRVRSNLLAKVGEADFQKYWDHGKAMSLDEAAKLALSRLE